MVTAGNASRAYGGAANPAITASAAGAQNGDTFSFTESTTAVAASPAGTYPIVPVATGANLANYTVVYVDGTLTVGQATLTVTAGNASRAYGAANLGLWSPPRRPAHRTAIPSASPRAPLKPCRGLAGRHLPDRSRRNRGEPGQLHRGLRRRHPDRGPRHPDGDRGQRQPRLRRRCQPGLYRIGGRRTERRDTFSFTESTTAVRLLRRSVLIRSFRWRTGANLANYTVVYVVNGTLTVGQATPTVTAGNASRAYGAANPAFTAIGCRRTERRHLHLHREHHRGRGLAGRDLSHRSCRYRRQPRQLHRGSGTAPTVGQATPTVTVGNASRAHGAANSGLTGIGGRRTERRYLQLHREHHSGHIPAGRHLYLIVPVATGANLANYTVVYVNGTLTVGQATLTRDCGQSPAAPMGRPTRRSLLRRPAPAERRHLQLHREHHRCGRWPRRPGTYPIVPVATGANLGNYTVVYVDGTLTVGQATPTVTAGNARPPLQGGQPGVHRLRLPAPRTAIPSASPRAPGGRGLAGPART